MADAASIFDAIAAIEMMPTVIILIYFDAIRRRLFADAGFTPPLQPPIPLRLMIYDFSLIDVTFSRHARLCAMLPRKAPEESAPRH